MYYGNYITEQIKEKISILDITDECGIKLKRTGRSYQGICPFHNERTPSFTVFPKTNTFKCFGCGIYGDQIKLYADLNNIDNGQAYALLKQRIGLTGKPKITKEQKIEISTRFENKQLENNFLKEIKRIYLSLCDIRDYMFKKGKQHTEMAQLEQDDLYILFCSYKHDFLKLINALLSSILDEIDFEQQVKVYMEAQGVECHWKSLIARQEQTLFVNTV